MKKYIISVFVMLSMVLQGCYDEQAREIDDILGRVEALEQMCSEYNSNIEALSKIMAAIQNKDYISSVSKITTGSGGYAVTFVKNGTITIYDGTSSHAPVVSADRDTDGQYYWSIRYYGKESQWLRDEDGDKVLAVGVIPILRIENGYWYVTYGKQENWIKLGKADGENGDSLFQSVIVASEFVVFKMWDGTLFKVPVFSLYNELVLASKQVNANSEALLHAVEAFESSLIFIEDVNEIKNEDGANGYAIKFSNGKVIEIFDEVRSNVPMISMKKEPDGLYYWTVKFPWEKEASWCLDADGNKIAASGKKISVPEVLPKKDDSDGKYYWAVVNASDTTYILDASSNKVHAVIDGSSSLFKSVDNSSDEYLLITLWDNTELKFAKKYAVELGSCPASVAVGGTVSVPYTIYGADNTVNVTLIVQGEVTALLAPGTPLGTGTLKITGKASSVNSKVLMVVHAGNNSAKVTVKSINISVVEV